MKQSLTKRQGEILSFIEECVDHEGFPPTIAEIGQRFGIRSSNGVSDHLAALERKGYISRSPKARSIRVLRSAGNSTEGMGLPVVGRIAAGEPLLAVENIDGYVQISPDATPHPDFALKVDGESMIGEGILPGDTLFVRKQDTAEDGQLVVALVDDEATVKRFYRVDGVVELRAANPEVPTMRVSARRVSIQGIVTGLQRRIT